MPLYCSLPTSRAVDRLKACAGTRSFFWSTNARSSHLAGTAPYHDSYILLHTHQHPSQYPPKSKSPLWKQLTLEARNWGGIVNFSWSSTQPVHPGYSGVGEDGGEERYYATAFSVDRAPLYIPEVSLANLAQVAGQLREHTQTAQLASEVEDNSADKASEVEAKVHLYVCTHGSRDCRCGDTGGDVAKTLHEEISKRDLWDRVSLGEVAHVGGHKYAANVLVYPFGDWLGMVQPFDVPRILDEILERRTALSAKQSPVNSVPPLCPLYWRGRMGLDKDGQLELASRS